MVKLRSAYQRGFFDEISTDSAQSAKVVLDAVFDVYRPQSVLDVGCGVGAWLAESAKRGAEIMGVDGPWVAQDQLRIPATAFQATDLTQSLELGRRFDLVMSLEVAEHLPEDRAAPFVDGLTRHADVILFSAAVPGQGGVRHVNEQWPQYWKDKFEGRGFELFDVLRGRLWDHPDVAWWYSQNVFLYAKGDAADVIRTAEPTTPLPLAVVHPGLLAKAVGPQGVRKESRDMVLAIASAVRKRVARRAAGDSLTP